MTTVLYNYFNANAAYLELLKGKRVRVRIEGLWFEVYEYDFLNKFDDFIKELHKDLLFLTHEKILKADFAYMEGYGEND